MSFAGRWGAPGRGFAFIARGAGARGPRSRFGGVAPAFNEGGARRAEGEPYNRAEGEQYH